MKYYFRFDQETALASFVPDWEDLVWTQRQRWPWVPLQSILQTYLDMIDEGKITTYSDRRKEAMEGVFGEFPWEIHQYTLMDVTRAIGAFNRLLDAIETRISSSSMQKSSDGDPGFKGISLPYSESVLEASFIEKDSFTGHFLSDLPTRHVNFRYIAPGIQLQDPDEFIDQPLADRRFNTLFPDLFSSKQPPSVFPFLLFRGQGSNKSPWTRPWFPDGNAEPIPSGLYIEPTEKGFNWESGNESRLLLPFSIGENGFARSSNGVPFDRARADQLYQEDLFSGYSGYLPWDSRSSYLHRVLDNWAERVERGDWVVDGDGVVGGIKKFKEADSEEHWREYFISYSNN